MYMKRNIISGLFVLTVVLIFFSCKDTNTYEKLRQNELEKLDAFIAENYPNVEPTASGLYFIETLKGYGDTIKAGDKVQIFYSTWTIDSLLIDESSGYSLGQRYEPFEFIVGSGSSISGLEEGVTYMQPGAKANLVINSELAYGQNGSSSVAGFTTLLMEVEIYKVFPATTN